MPRRFHRNRPHCPPGGKDVGRGKSFDTNVGQVFSLSITLNTFFTITDLNWLIKGGRIKPERGADRQYPDIKPILQVNNGLMEVIGKVRGRKNSLNTVSIFGRKNQRLPDQIIA
jgi:fatty acid-binding protein DegV